MNWTFNPSCLIVWTSRFANIHVSIGAIYSVWYVGICETSSRSAMFANVQFRVKPLLGMISVDMLAN